VERRRREQAQEEPMNQSNRQRERDALVAEIEAEVRETRRYTGRAQLKPEVIEAMRRVERHRFVAQQSGPSAYRDHAMPIGHGQTISQPYIVALMTDLLEIDQHSKVLEIGTGCGYQAAVLAEIADHVYTLEIIPALEIEARQRLESLGYHNVTVALGNGRAGWPEQAPFDAIIVTAAAESIPPALLQQLRPGGRMVIPIGQPGWGQSLELVTKTEDGQIDQREVLPVAFVPLTGRDDESAGPV
jgi:protein-L-isoaspartate(D-aspartate) O-methyltransferase